MADGMQRRSQRIRGRAEAAEAQLRSEAEGEAQPSTAGLLTPNAMRAAGLRPPTSRAALADGVAGDESGVDEDIDPLACLRECRGVETLEQEIENFHSRSRRPKASKRQKLLVKYRHRGKKSILEVLTLVFNQKIKLMEKRRRVTTKKKEVIEPLRQKAILLRASRHADELEDRVASVTALAAVGADRPKKKPKAKATMSTMSRTHMSLPQSAAPAAPASREVRPLDLPPRGHMVKDADDDEKPQMRAAISRPKAKSTAIENLRKGRARVPAPPMPNVNIMGPKQVELPSSRGPPLAPVPTRHPPAQPPVAVMGGNMPPKLPGTGVPGKGKKAVEYVAPPVGKGRKIVDFAAGPLGKGRKVPAEPWNWPTEIMTRHRTRQGTKALMFG